jgi:hypothetical protein
LKEIGACGKITQRGCNRGLGEDAFKSDHHTKRDWDKVLKKFSLWSPNRLKKELIKEQTEKTNSRLHSLSGGDSLLAIHHLEKAVSVHGGDSLLANHALVYQISLLQHSLWSAWKSPGAYPCKGKDSRGHSVARSCKSSHFNVGGPQAVATATIKSTADFHAFILFNPSADLATDMERMCGVWASWVRSGVINIYLAIPADSSDLALPESCTKYGVRRFDVPEKAGYPPVKLVLAMWKQAYTQLKSLFTPKVSMLAYTIR